MYSSSEDNLQVRKNGSWQNFVPAKYIGTTEKVKISDSSLSDYYLSGLSTQQLVNYAAEGFKKLTFVTFSATPNLYTGSSKAVTYDISEIPTSAAASAGYATGNSFTLQGSSGSIAMYPTNSGNSYAGMLVISRNDTALNGTHKMYLSY